MLLGQTKSDLLQKILRQKKHSRKQEKIQETQERLKKKAKTNKRASLCVGKQAGKHFDWCWRDLKENPSRRTGISNDITVPGSNPVAVTFSSDATSLNKLYYLPGSYFACIPGASYVHPSSVFWGSWLPQYTAMHWRSLRLSRRGYTHDWEARVRTCVVT